ncbi:MazG nucleotide pyrophosphohydrolase domain-containing protein [Alkaliphilus transvaalensis]|uniref:MazG nucleotide pyrophosphohydrolase domain-containing protein n=1 Tax=Alkaliphilus transvaalensis TaxID=114628 RepID=UPI00047AB16A|nr:MazG nucleotide pyrophosphohydrolase domain-containing protein [Alkaliphilus transvaalensis]
MELKDIQNKVEVFIKNNNLDATVEVRVLDLVSEVGELAKEVLKGSNYGKKSLALSDEWEKEIGDVLFSLITIANMTSIDLEKSLIVVLDKYKKRMEEKGHIASDA